MVTRSSLERLIIFNYYRGHLPETAKPRLRLCLGCDNVPPSLNMGCALVTRSKSSSQIQIDLGDCKPGPGFLGGGWVAPGQFMDRDIVELECPSGSMEEATTIFLPHTQT